MLQLPMNASTAADSEVLRLLAASSDRASTAVASAEDDLSLFGCVESPRLLVEIMDFKRFNTVTCHSINDLVPTHSAKKKRK